MIEKIDQQRFKRPSPKVVIPRMVGKCHKTEGFNLLAMMLASWVQAGSEDDVKNGRLTLLQQLSAGKTLVIVQHVWSYI